MSIINTKSNIYTLRELKNNLLFNTSIQFYGWIRRLRIAGSGSIIFIDIYDGTTVGCLKGIATQESYVSSSTVNTLSFLELSESTKLSCGCAVVVNGLLVESPKETTQLFELQIHKLQVIGEIDNCVTYPIQKSNEKNLLTLRQLPFIRMKTQLIQCLFRIRSSLLFTIHSFFHNRGVVCTDPNILTSSDCEGAGEVFKVSPQLFGKDSSVGLTVSSQLPLEALATGFKEVYTCQKSFRAEKSDTSKHLAEFLHVEYESYFTTLPKLLNFTEDFVKHCIKETITIRKDDFDFLESKFSPKELHGTRQMLLNLIQKNFVRIKHKDAVDLIRKLVKDKVKLPDNDGKLKRVKVKVWPEYDGDLASEHEKLLVKYFDNFVFVTHWPLKIKSFYMKQCDDDTCESFDLLAPSVGEMFGGSMREWRYDKLNAEIKRREMDITPIQWYLDLRKSGSAPHGGWGMGFARMLMLLTGVSSVRDIVPFPVYYNHCPY